ncbi:hypothetical protein [Candidatus Poriferisodalis sp.]|uniref:hypothetical protein n=1 Tax=Candidatus Poriferisodalis sp. TaxID=3101277 RepID=UPI003AF7D6C7
MAIDEIERTAMVQQLINTLGEQPANTLMKCILPDGADQVATKADLHALQAATKADLHALQAATKADIRALQAATKADIRALQAATKADIRALEAGTKADIRALEAGTKADIRALGERLRAESKTDFAELTRTVVSQNRTQMFTMAGFMITIWVTVLTTGLS